MLIGRVSDFTEVIILMNMTQNCVLRNTTYFEYDKIRTTNICYLSLFWQTDKIQIRRNYVIRNMTQNCIIVFYVTCNILRNIIQLCST